MRTAAGLLRQRLRVVAQRAQIEDHVGPLLRLLDAGEGHLGAGYRGLRPGDELVERLIGPRLVVQRGHRLGVAVVLLVGVRAADDIPLIRSDLVRAALVEAVAGAALLRLPP